MQKMSQTDFANFFMDNFDSIDEIFEFFDKISPL